MTENSASPPPLKTLSSQDWESVIEDFQHGGPQLQRWTAPHLIPGLLDQAFVSLLKKDFPLKLPLLLFLEEFADTLFASEDSLERLLETLRAALHAPLDGVTLTYHFKEQFLVSTTSVIVSLDVLARFRALRCTETLVELLLTVINRPNHGPDRQTRAIACECLRELEKCYPCLLSEVGGHVWSLCQSERTHASQSYILLFTRIVYNIVNFKKYNVSILVTSVPLVPFNVPQSILLSNSIPTNGGGSGSSSSSISLSSNKDFSSNSVGLNYKDLRRAMAFLLESVLVLTPYAMVDFLGIILPMAVSLELQASMLKVQFFGMIYSFDPLLCHGVLLMYSHFSDALDGQEAEIVKRIMLISKETQNHSVFRFLALHWLLGLLSRLIQSKEVGKYKMVVDMGLRFYPAVFEPLALKALKLDLLAFCSTYLGVLTLKSGSTEEAGGRKSVGNLFEDSLVSVSAFQWLPPWSAETAVAFRAFHRFVIAESIHSDIDPSTTRIFVQSVVLPALQEILIDMALEFQRLVPVIVSFIDRLLGCQKDCWLGECMLQTIDEHLLPRVKINYQLVSYFPVFNRIAENNTIPSRALLDLLIKFMIFIVEKHTSNTGLISWSRGSKVLGICRTMLVRRHRSRLFLGLSHLLAFTCLYFPDLEVRDNARIYLRMLISIPGPKLRDILNLGEQLLGISSSQHVSSFFNVPSPRKYQNIRKSRHISSYVHIERKRPLLVKQCWSLSLSPFDVGSSKPTYAESIRDGEHHVVSGELDNSTDSESISKTEIRSHSLPLCVTDSKISEIFRALRRHFSCIPDFRHMPGIKVRICCSLRFESEPFKQVWMTDASMYPLDGVDALPAMYAAVLKFSSSAPYGSIPSCHVPFLLGEPPKNDRIFSSSVLLDIVPSENGYGEESFKAPVTIDLKPEEPTPGLVDVFIEATAEHGQIIYGQLQSITVGIEDMFLKPIVPSEVPEEAIPAYYSELFDSLWQACDASTNMGREIFPLKGGRGVAAISGTKSVKLLEVPSDSVIQAIEQHLAPFVVSVIGEQLVNMVKDGGIIKSVMLENAKPDPFHDNTRSFSDVYGGLLQLTYVAEEEEDDRESRVNVSRRNMGSFLVLIFLPPRFHLLFQMEVSDTSTLARIRTDHWPCLAYVDDYLEALFLA